MKELDNFGQQVTSPNGNNLWSGQDEIKPARLSDYLRTLYRGRWIIALSFVLIVAGTVYYSYTTPPTFEAACQVIVDEAGGLQRTLFDGAAYGQQLTKLNNQLQILESRQMAARVIDHLLISPMKDSLSLFAVEEPNRVMNERNLGIGRIRRAMEVSLVRDTDIIEIKIKAANAWEAAYLANQVAEVYKTLDQENSQTEITKVVDFLDEQLRNIESELKASEEALRSFQQTTGAFSLTGEAETIVNQLVSFESAYQEAQTNLKTHETQLSYLNSQLGQHKERLEADLAEISHPLIVELRNKIAQSEATLVTYRIQGLSEDYPQMQKEIEKGRGLKQALTDETKKMMMSNIPLGDPLLRNQKLLEKIIETETEVQAFRARAQALEGVVEEYSQNLEALPQKTLRLARLERARKLNENVYLMMKEKYEESRITRAGQVGKIRVVDEAVPPGYPISPQKEQNIILAILIGLGLGTGLTFLIEYMDHSIHTLEDVERLNLPVLGSIPEIRQEEGSGRWFHGIARSSRSKHKSEAESSQMAERLITHLKPKSPISEAYRSMRTQIQYARAESPIKTMLISSPGPGEGKSTSAANLAIALSQMGSRTLLVDADLRRPVLHSMFGLERDVGLSNYLVGERRLEDIIKQSPIDNLELITTGILPPNPSEMLGSMRMKGFMDEVSQLYNHVLFDSPPIIAVTDALVLAPLVDGVITVLRSGKTDKDAVLRAFDLLRNVNGKVLGALLNDVSSTYMYGSYYYYYYYYYYYGESGNKKRGKRGKHSGKKRRQHQHHV